MANALEEVSRRAKAPEPPRQEGPTTSDVARMLAGIDQDKANALMAAFDAATREAQTTMGEAMWTLAMLQARILASAEMGGEQVWVAARFAELVALALPGMMLAVERAKHAVDGRPPTDA